MLFRHSGFERRKERKNTADFKSVGQACDLIQARKLYDFEISALILLIVVFWSF